MQHIATLNVTVDDLNLRAEPSTRHGNATILKVLHRGDAVEHIKYTLSDPSWATVRAADGTIGFVKRMLLYQSNAGNLGEVRADLMTAYNKAVWDASLRYDRVTYKLGAKNPNDGRVDCSGWIAFINRLAFNAVNTAAGWHMFDRSALELLNTHSDHQVSIPGYIATQLYSLENVSSLPWRPGLLIGINFADYDWEKDQGRVFEIDHIVQTMADGNGEIFVTQSSSGGGGVNFLRRDAWLRGQVETLRSRNRLHVVDIFALGQPQTLREAPMEKELLDLPELDVSRTPAG